jgi:hypothetical protein
MFRTAIPLIGAVILGGAGASHAAEPRPLVIPKQVAAPPSDILDGTVRLPEPGAVMIESASARIAVTLSPDADGTLAWTGEIPIDTGVGVRMMLLQPVGEPLTWDIAPPQAGGARTLLAPEIVRADIEAMAATPIAELRAFPVAASGRWTVRVRGAANAAAPREAWIMVASDSPHLLRSGIDTLGHVPGGTATINADLRTDARSAEAAIITEAVVRIGDQEFEMLDDGAHGDGAADDGLFGARIPLERVGALEARVEARGITDTGAEFVRTIDHRIAVAPGGVMLVPDAAPAAISADAGTAASQVRIDLPVVFDDPTRRVVVAAEVWGVHPHSGESVPAVWAAIITEPRTTPDGSTVVSLYVDRRWLAAASVVGPFELRHARIHDLDTFVPVAHREVVPVAVVGDLELPGAAPRAIDPAMLRGVPRPDLAMAITLPEEDISGALSGTRAFGAHNLMLSHGYCAGGSPWPQSNFTGFLEAFSDPNQNRTHDQFAQLLLVFGFGSKSYGLLGHSQGGCAALHLWNFYFSGLDWAEGPRLIQSVGTPYQGTPLASLGGFSCGVNNDLTPAGAATWLSTIPNESRAAVHYWTTSYSGSWCDFFANFILSAPNDGVVEVARGQLPGANNMGNTVGWCHTTGMSNPAQYTDAARNSDLNANAAR